MPDHYQYYVEGKMEYKMVNCLCRMGIIPSGKVSMLNPVQEHISSRNLMILNSKTIVILIFDTDTESSSILDSNISMLKKTHRVKKVVCIPQCRNLEEELVYCCDIHSVKEIFRSQSVEDYKKAFCSCSDIEHALKRKGFNPALLWTRAACGCFSHIHNDFSSITQGNRRKTTKKGATNMITP